MRQMLANGTINPSRFVMVDTSDDNKVIQATTNAKCLGIATEGSNYPPLDDIVSTNYAAIAGQELRVYEPGEICLIETGDVVTAGDYLKADSDGKAVPILTTGTTLQRYGAQAMQAATVAGQKILALILIGSERPALT
jgi:hypothetical protein